VTASLICNVPTLAERPLGFRSPNKGYFARVFFSILFGRTNASIIVCSFSSYIYIKKMNTTLAEIVSKIASQGKNPDVSFLKDNPEAQTMLLMALLSSSQAQQVKNSQTNTTTTDNDKSRKSSGSISEMNSPSPAKSNIHLYIYSKSKKKCILITINNNSRSGRTI
jgi:hypothetical protein